MQVNAQRIPGVSALRKWARARFFRLLGDILGLEDTRRILSREFERQNFLDCPKELYTSAVLPVPYAELRREDANTRSKRIAGAIFISGRFRSGSTLLWNLFRHLPGVTAYYEPFNERRWFDRRTRGTHIDPTHLSVSDYWSEYDGLEELGAYFDERWKFEQLYMPEHAWNASMQRYIEILIERAAGRAVLQFNEVDMRLPWLRAKFPGVRILHIFRHPREQWCSILPKSPSHAIGRTLRDFPALDGFYLLPWGKDLRHYFPFLSLEPEVHPYELFYQIWKLSYVFGRFHADYSVSFEEIVENPRASIQRVFAALEIDDYDVDGVVQLVRPQHLAKWKQSPDAGEFERIEAGVDATFESYAAQIVEGRLRTPSLSAAGDS